MEESWRVEKRLRNDVDSRSSCIVKSEKKKERKKTSAAKNINLFAVNRLGEKWNKSTTKLFVWLLTVFSLLLHFISFLFLCSSLILCRCIFFTYARLWYPLSDFRPVFEFHFNYRWVGRCLFCERRDTMRKKKTTVRDEKSKSKQKIKNKAGFALIVPNWTSGKKRILQRQEYFQLCIDL